MHVISVCHPPSEPLLTENLAMVWGSAFYLWKINKYIASQVGEIFCFETLLSYYTYLNEYYCRKSWLADQDEFPIMTSCNEYLNSVGKVKYFLIWSQGNGCMHTMITQFHYINNNLWIKKTCLHKHIANCNGQLKKHSSQSSRQFRNCHQMFLYLYPSSHSVSAFLLPHDLGATLLLTKCIPRLIWSWTYITSIDTSHPSHLH